MLIDTMPADPEAEHDRGGMAPSEGAQVQVARVLTSTGSTAAQTTFRCEVVALIHREAEGIPVEYESMNSYILVSNLSNVRPPTDGTALVPVFQADDRKVMYY